MLWYLKPVKTGICNVLVNKSFISRQSQWTGSDDFTPRLYFHAFISSIVAVVSHFASCHICHALHWLIHINSRRPQTSTTATSHCFRQLAAAKNVKKCMYFIFNSMIIFISYLVYLSAYFFQINICTAFTLFISPLICQVFRKYLTFPVQTKKVAYPSRANLRYMNPRLVLVVFKCPLHVHAEPKSAWATLIKAELITNSWIGPQLRHMLRMNY